MSILGGFGMTLAMAKKQDPQMFTKGFAGSREIPESGVSLATRALARGSLYSVAGVGIFCYAVWKLLGVHSMVEFRQKVGTILPTIPKKDNPGRGDFMTIRDLFNYIIEEDEKEKREKKAKEIS
ncbi:transmembrane protein 242 isoform X2 [Aplysia californica]|nr:transmembrane protein 242 isoform X2 [Aplysia californica]